MNEYIHVNGARIERSYFEDNVAEALECDWELASQISYDHVHCIVCDVAILKGMVAFRAENRWLCQYCKEHFVSPKS